MEVLKDIEVILAARSAQAVWQHYVARLTGLGFPNVSYHAIRVLETSCGQMLDDSILLSSYSPRLMQELVSLDLLESTPLYLSLTNQKSSESWDGMQRRRLAGRLSPREERVIDIFARYGHVAGYVISMNDDVEHIRAVILLSGTIGMRQDKLDELWARHGQLVEALSGLINLRISTLPYAEGECVLTVRQREVLECISAGHTMQEIAEILKVTPATVEKHLRLARKALGAKTTAQAILLAARRKQIFISSAEPSITMSGSSSNHLGKDVQPQRFLSPLSDLPSEPGRDN